MTEQELREQIAKDIENLDLGGTAQPHTVKSVKRVLILNFSMPYSV